MAVREGTNALLGRLQSGINARLFHGRLSYVPIEVDNASHFTAYYDGKTLKIGVNLALLKTFPNVCCAIGHELCHHHQWTWGRSSSLSHDYNFAMTMLQIGLLPMSNTGQLCGHNVADCLIPCGPMDAFIEHWLEKEPGLPQVLFL